MGTNQNSTALKPIFRKSSTLLYINVTLFDRMQYYRYLFESRGFSKQLRQLVVSLVIYRKNEADENYFV